MTPQRRKEGRPGSGGAALRRQAPPSSPGLAASRQDLFISRASTEASVVLEPHAPECELVVTTRAAGQQEKGYLFVDGPGVFRQSEHGQPDLTDGQLRALARHSELTYTLRAPDGLSYRRAVY